jgi:hypothetical protein
MDRGHQDLAPSLRKGSVCIARKEVFIDSKSQVSVVRFRFLESKLVCYSSDRLFQDRRAAASGSVTVQRLAIDKGTFEWYKRRISGGIKSLILLLLLNADDSPPLFSSGRKTPMSSTGD